MFTEPENSEKLALLFSCQRRGGKSGKKEITHNPNADRNNVWASMVGQVSRVSLKYYSFFNGNWQAKGSLEKTYTTTRNICPSKCLCYHVSFATLTTND